MEKFTNPVMHGKFIRVHLTVSTLLKQPKVQFSLVLTLGVFFRTKGGIYKLKGLGWFNIKTLTFTCKV